MHSTNSGLHKKLKEGMTHFLFLVIMVSISVALTACEDSSGPGYGNGNGNGNGNEPGSNEVWMVGQSFTPSDLQVEIGTTVTWINQSEVIHTVTSGAPDNPDDMFDSGDVSPGDEFSYTFNETGTYNYFCIPHQPSMTGRVTVTDNGDGNG